MRASKLKGSHILFGAHHLVFPGIPCEYVIATSPNVIAWIISLKLPNCSSSCSWCLRACILEGWCLPRGCRWCWLPSSWSRWRCRSHSAGTARQDSVSDGLSEENQLENRFLISQMEPRWPSSWLAWVPLPTSPSASQWWSRQRSTSYARCQVRTRNPAGPQRSILKKSSSQIP